MSTRWTYWLWRESGRWVIHFVSLITTKQQSGKDRLSPRDSSDSAATHLPLDGPTPVWWDSWLSCFQTPRSFITCLQTQIYTVCPPLQSRCRDNLHILRLWLSCLYQHTFTMWPQSPPYTRLKSLTNHKRYLPGWSLGQNSCMPKG